MVSTVMGMLWMVAFYMVMMMAWTLVASVTSVKMNFMGMISAMTVRTVLSSVLVMASVVISMVVMMTSVIVILAVIVVFIRW